MVSIRCSVFSIGDCAVPAGATDGLAEKFSDATEGELVLSFADRGHVEVPGGLESSSEVAASELHAVIGEMTGNRDDSGPVNEIALVFAPRYGPVPSAFGVMFDRGPSNSPDDPDSGPLGAGLYSQVAREGCAVFLDGIADRRSQGQRKREIRFTCGHELGHVFNLSHRQSPANFLYKDADDGAPPGDEWFSFTEGQKSFLSGIEEKLDNPVMPGGLPFGDTGFFSAPHSQPRHGRRENPVQLKLSATPAVAYHFEPIELQLVVTPQKGLKSVTVPNCFDPAFPQFDIWIEDPTGERRRYQALKTYCGPTERLVVDEKKPYFRDISLFWQSSGYTFRRAGSHRVVVEIRGLAKEVVRAETEIEILNFPGKGATAFHHHRLVMMTTKSELFFRRVLGKRDALTRLREHTDSLKKGLLKDCCSNAVGRIYDAEMRLAPPNWRSRFADLAQRHLETSLESGNLNPTRILRAHQALDRIQAWRKSR